jgi:phosphoribosylformylglycinamidine synthase
MRAAVVLFPGLNAETEMIRTVRDVAGIPTYVARHTDTALEPGTTLAVIPGGFSYGDYLRCGAIAKVAPILPALREHADRGGYLLGVCNGFQVLTEAGILPGALTRNESLKFVCKDVFLRVDADGPFTKGVATRVLRLPVAHGEGRYVADAALVATLEREGRIAFRYCDGRGEVPADANPNGSVSNIAGIYGGKNKNVLGLMPHPERMSEAVLGGVDGRVLFDSIARTMRLSAAS